MIIKDNYKIKIPYINKNTSSNGKLSYKDEIGYGVITSISESDINKDGVLVIPENVVYIDNTLGDSIVRQSTNKLRKIVVPSSFKSFGRSSFVNEKNLRRIEINNNTNEINFDFDAFLNSGLEELIVDKALNISEGTFYGNKNLKKIWINDLYNLEAHSFSNCTNLESITINNNPSYVQGSDFELCYNIKEMTLGYGYKLPILVGGDSVGADIISGDCFKKAEPFRLTYVVNLDKTKDEYDTLELEKLIMNLARKQFFEIDNYSFVNGKIMYGNYHLLDFFDLFNEYKDLDYRFSKTEFCFKIIFRDKENLLIPINDYFSIEAISSDKVLKKIINS